VGYAGAPEAHPTYRNIKGHAEVLRVTFDPKSLSFAEILGAYRDWHSPRRSMGQYRSVLIPSNPEQQEEVDRYLRWLEGRTAPHVIQPGTLEARFWDAEDYHQKHRLRRNPAMVQVLHDELGPQWDRHSIATKLNADRRGSFDPAPWLDLLTPQGRAYFLGG
jgi:peptide-methionine (S)-S-oxide reductase